MKAKYIDHMGTDDSVANYARLSFADDAARYTVEQNNQLIRFLARGVSSKDWDDVRMMVGCGIENPDEFIWRLKTTPCHFAPFAHPHITLRMAAPVSIRTQCFKHKIGFTESEESRRYIKTTPQIYVPDFRAMAPNVKQGSLDVLHPNHEQIRAAYIAHTTSSVEMYEDLIEEGLAPEVARFLLPQGAIVNWVWTGSLYAYANFYIQRSDSHAQKEVQELAELVREIIEPLYPVAWRALTTGN